MLKSLFPSPSSCLSLFDFSSGSSVHNYPFSPPPFSHPPLPFSPSASSAPIHFHLPNIYPTPSSFLSPLILLSPPTNPIHFPPSRYHLSFLFFPMSCPLPSPNLNLIHSLTLPPYLVPAPNSIPEPSPTALLALLALLLLSFPLGDPNHQPSRF